MFACIMHDSLTQVSTVSVPGVYQLSIIQVSTDWVLCVQYTGWVILCVYGLNVWYHWVYANLLTECILPLRVYMLTYWLGVYWVYRWPGCGCMQHTPLIRPRHKPALTTFNNSIINQFCKMHFATEIICFYRLSGKVSPL